jgi:hypothetical protein
MYSERLTIAMVRFLSLHNDVLHQVQPACFKACTVVCSPGLLLTAAQSSSVSGAMIAQLAVLAVLRQCTFAADPDHTLTPCAVNDLRRILASCNIADATPCHDHRMTTSRIVLVAILCHCHSQQSEHTPAIAAAAATALACQSTTPYTTCGRNTVQHCTSLANNAVVPQRQPPRWMQPQHAS